MKLLIKLQKEILFNKDNIKLCYKYINQHPYTEIHMVTPLYCLVSHISLHIYIFFFFFQFSGPFEARCAQTCHVLQLSKPGAFLQMFLVCSRLAAFSVSSLFEVVSHFLHTKTLPWCIGEPYLK